MSEFLQKSKYVLKNPYCFELEKCAHPCKNFQDKFHLSCFSSKNVHFYEGNFALEDYFYFHKNAKIYEGNFALQAFLHFDKNAKIYEGNFALQAFFILEKFVVFDGPSFLKSKVRTFF